MKVAVIYRDIQHKGGAERSMETLIELLKKRGHRVLVVRIDPLLISKFKILIFRWIYKKEIKRIIRFKPDVIFSQHEGILVGNFVAKTLKIPHVYFIRDLLLFRGSSNQGNILRKISRTLKRKILLNLHTSVDIIIANSKYTAKVCEEYVGRKVEYIYPLIYIKNVRIKEHNPKYILHINPNVHKGIYITLEIARILKDFNFLIIGVTNDKKILREIKKMKNITYAGYQSDMKKIYSLTKITLVPSIWEEAFGRVAVESGINKIPAIVSSRGGLPEAVGVKDLIVKDYMNPEEYIEKIYKVLDNYEFYQRKIRKGTLRKTARFQIRKMYKILKKKGIYL